MLKDSLGKGQVQHETMQLWECGHKMLILGGPEMLWTHYHLHYCFKTDYLKMPVFERRNFVL